MQRLDFDDLFKNTGENANMHSSPVSPRYHYARPRLPPLDPVRIVDVLCITMISLFVISAVADWQTTTKHVATTLLWLMDSAVVIAVLAILGLVFARLMRRVFRRF